MTFVLGLLAMLGILIFFHELGHFLVAKACGVRVMVFSLGFGPRVVGFKWGDTDYRLSLLPLGGYVRMFGDNFSIEVPDEEKQYAFLEKPYWQKMAIASAGPIANFLLPVGILFFMFWGQETVLVPAVGMVVPGEAAENAGIQAGDRVLSLDGIPMETYRDLRVYLVARPDQDVKVTLQRGSTTVDVTLQPRGVSVFDPTDPGLIEGRIGILPYTRAPLIDVVKDSPAAKAGLLGKDRVIAVADVKTARVEDVLAAIDAFDQNAPMPLTVQRTVKGESEEVTLTVPPPGDASVDVAADLVTYAVTSDEIDPALARRLAESKKALLHHAALLQRRRGIDIVEGRVGTVTEKSPAEKIGLVTGDRVVRVDGRALTYGGEEDSRLMEAPDDIHTLAYLHDNTLTLALFRLAPRPEWGMESIKVFGARTETALEGGISIERRIGPVDAFTRAAKSTWMLLGKTVDGIRLLVTGGVSLKSLGGPITIARVAESAIEQGFDRFIEALCFISVNLGLVNLLPIPVLDGGHLTIFTLQAIRRKKLSLRQMDFAYKIGLAFLGLIMVAAMYNDIMREILS